MKWPVSAEIVETMIADFQRRMDMATARYDALLDKYHALKVSGAIDTTPQPEKPVDVVTQAIMAKAHGHPILFRHFQTYVAERRALGTPDQDIANEIMRGQSDQEIDDLAQNGLS